MREQRKLEKWTIFCKLKKVVCIALYGPAISQSAVAGKTVHILEVGSRHQNGACGNR